MRNGGHRHEILTHCLVHLYALFDVADLLACEYEPEDKCRDNWAFDPISAAANIAKLREDLHGFELVYGLC